MFDNRFTIQSGTPAYARKIVRSTLSGADRGVVEDAVLLTSELVADSMMRSDNDPQLLIDTREGHVYIEVRDSGYTTPHVDRKRLSEWVLLIVNALASSWGIESHRNGQLVWFDLAF